MDYYDGTKLLSMKDINRKEPELYLCCANRTAGKTVYFSRLLINSFIKKGKKFGLIYRFNYELSDVADAFFKEIGALFFNGMDFTAKTQMKGLFCDLYLNDEHCGYALSLNNADQLKKCSHLFSDIDHMFIDEFQSENNKYCPNEIRKFISLHTTIARGSGKQYRRVPVYMCSNQVTILNPYYIALGISQRLTDKTHYLRGDGYILETTVNESAKNAQKESAFNKAFSNEHYTKYSSENVYLNDNTSFIEQMKGRSRYLATIRYDGVDYALKEYANQGIIYCDNKVDKSCKTKIVVNTDDHQVNYVMLKKHEFTIQAYQTLFRHGCFRFKNLKCKEAVLNLLSY